jgi:putative transposase
MVNFEHIEFEPLDRIMKRIKGASARYANLELDRTGSTFWQKESYDRFVRTERELNNTIAYILNNPVKANLVSKWDEFPFTFLKYCE